MNVGEFKGKRSERTCCVCRSKGGKRELERLVYGEGSLMWDERQVAPGRGAYIHLKPDCLSKMTQIARWERSLRISSGMLNISAVHELAQRMLAHALRRD